MKKTLPILLIAVVYSICAVGQDDLLKELEQSEPAQTVYAIQTFKGTRLVNGHSVETKAKGDLEFIFAHRFGAINGGIYELFGMDDAYVRLGLDYGVTDRLSASIGRNSVDKTLDGYLKYKITRQQKGATTFPVTITGLAGAAYKSSPRKEDLPPNYESVDRLAYVAQLLIARKVNSHLSLQLMPTLIHKNAVDRIREDNNQFAVGVGGRYKITKSVAFTTEYYYRLEVPAANESYNTLGFGIDIETGGHVFQLVFTNTRGLTERSFITETEGDFGDGDIHFGFNITRTFQLGRKK